MERDRGPAFREHMRAMGKRLVSEQFAETLHEANAVLRQRDRYDPPTVSINESIRDKIYGYCKGYFLETLEIDRIAEDEYNRRLEERRRQEQDGEFAT